MQTPAGPSSLFVVDTRPADYMMLASAVAAGRLELHLVSSGRAALRWAQRRVADVWIVNVELPDMSGFDFCEMLASSGHGTSRFLIGDQYRADDELRSLELGVSRYLCKPIEPAWFDELRLPHGFHLSAGIPPAGQPIHRSCNRRDHS